MIPADDRELIDILETATRERIPVTASGSGTGVTGGRVAQGGWTVSLEKFQRLEIFPGHAIAGAGVSIHDLQAAAARTGQFYAPDPTERTASVGGTIATNASGSRSFLYGSTRKHVLALRAYRMDGSKLEVRRGDAINFDVEAIPLPQTTKHNAGYRLQPGMDWIDLLAGSEGTLAMVVEAELKLLPIPKELLTGVVFFPTDRHAIYAVEQWRALDGLRMLEYLDGNSLTLLRQRYPEIPTGARAALMVEQTGDDADAWEARLEQTGAMGESSWFAIDAQDRERFRRFRHALPEIVNETVRRRGFLKLGSDFAVPVERNREMMGFYHDRLDELFPGAHVIFGHIGDAHVHVNLLPASESDVELGKRLMLEFAARAVELGGTVSAEHGLGKRRAHLLPLQYTPQQIEAMKAVKRHMDPLWLLGRGTLFADLG